MVVAMVVGVLIGKMLRRRSHDLPHPHPDLPVVGIPEPRPAPDNAPNRSRLAEPGR